MVVKQDPKRIGRVDISDLNKDKLVMWQHRNYLWLGPFAAFIFPAIIAKLGWGDFLGGLYYAGMARAVFLHHATFCVNSLAHYLGETSFDDRRTPRDHFITALVTMGEGYHNFHHEFPSDYRNAIFFWQYDPTKWLIWTCSLVGLTYNLHIFPENEVQKGRLQMQEKKINDLKKKLNWGVPVEELPEWSWNEFISLVEKEGRQYLIVDHIVYDVGGFLDDHPGGRGFLKSSIGRDVTASFNGSIYYHSNAARNLSTQMRVGKMAEEVPEDAKAKEE
jgi:stearoyl-CoA desaturase (delta-9 desaturase)